MMSRILLAMILLFPLSASADATLVRRPPRPAAWQRLETRQPWLRTRKPVRRTIIRGLEIPGNAMRCLGGVCRAR